MKRFIASLVLLTSACSTTRQAETQAPPPVQAAKPTPPSPLYVFNGVEIFGTRKVPKEKLLELIDMPAPGTRVDPSQKEFVDRLIESKKRLLAAYPFPFCRFSVVQWADHSVRLTVNVVEAGDEWRMAFSPEPKGDVADPEGLLAAWSDYQKRFWALQKEGAVPEYGAGKSHCQALICHGGFDHPELAPLEPRFVEGVPRNADALVRVLREDKDAGKRMNVLFVLPYIQSREWLVQAALPAVKDPDQGVRNEALRLLGMVQEGQPRVLIPLEPVLDALWFPTSTDRNKAGWALVRIVETEGTAHRQQILDKAGEVLVEMAGMQEKVDHEPARKVLAVLAGHDYGDDVAAWRRWVEQSRTPGATAHP